MALMIPSNIPADNESAAEQWLFAQFESECPADWIVLHSLDLARREARPFGEADFVVLIPNHGVVVIEAKTYLARTAAGMWQVERDGDPTPKSPFQQANRAMYGVKEWLEERKIPRLLYVAVVVVPYKDVGMGDDRSARMDIEWAPHQLIDHSRLHGRPLQTLLCDALHAQRKLLRNKPEVMTRPVALLVKELLRPEVESYDSPSKRSERTQDELRRFTEEQFRTIDQFSQNPRVLVDGLAGTGKTMLALEATRRAVSGGRRVLLLCYNRLLAEMLARETEAFGERCVACTLHDHLRRVAGHTHDPPHGSGASDYWNQELPLEVLDTLTASDVPEALLFDQLVVDEAQDLIGNELFLDVMDASLAQGLRDGRWQMFGDYGRQAIFGELEALPREVIERRLGFQPTLVSLRENCRNTKRVSALADSLVSQIGGGGDAGYLKVRRGDDFHDPTVRFYLDVDEQRTALMGVLDQLVSEGFPPGDIVILSRHGYVNCVAASIDLQPWCDRLGPHETAAQGHARYASVYKFKGLEAPAVVLTDIDALEAADSRWNDDDDARSLIYVGATRAVSRLAILAHQSWRGVLPLEPLDEFGGEPSRVQDVAAVMAEPPTHAATAEAKQPEEGAHATGPPEEPVQQGSGLPSREPWFVLKIGRFKIGA